MNERIKTARKNAKLTQEKLANEIHLSRNFITLVESGKEKPSERTIIDIARVCGVNETWLRTGEGEMYSPTTRQQEIAAMFSKLYKKEDSFRDALVDIVVEMDENEMNFLKKYAIKLAEIDLNDKFKLKVSDKYKK